MAAQTIADRGVSERLPRRLRQPVDTSAVLASAAHRAELPTDSTVVTKRSAGRGRRINVSHQPSVHHAGSAGRRRRHHGRLTARRPSVGSSRMQLAAIQWQPARSGADADSPPRGSRTSTTAVSRGITGPGSESCQCRRAPSAQQPGPIRQARCRSSKCPPGSTDLAGPLSRVVRRPLSHGAE